MKKKAATKTPDWRLTGCRVCFALPLQDCFGRGTAYPHQCRIADARNRDLCVKREGPLAEERKLWNEIARNMECLAADYIEIVSRRALNWRRERERHQIECPKCKQDEKNWRPVSSLIPKFPPTPSPKSHRAHR